LRPHIAAGRDPERADHQHASCREVRSSPSPASRDPGRCAIQLWLNEVHVVVPHESTVVTSLPNHRV
jgi:hypothetical protein